MVMLGQSSFRRVLLSRIMLLSIPVLLLGVAVTFRKARTSLLETARQNLTESATRKADSVKASIEALQTSVEITSETSILQSGSLEETRTFLTQLVSQLPTRVSCIKLTDWRTDRVVVSTCGYQATEVPQISTWPLRQDASNPNLSEFRILPIVRQGQTEQPNLQSRLNVSVSAPVYDRAGKIRYTLTVQSTLQQIESGKPGSLLGYTVIIDQNGTILAHPSVNRVGRNIAQEGDADRLRSIVDDALEGKRDVKHLFSFSDNSTEWLAGFSPVEIPVNPEENNTWVVLAVTRLDNALHGLEDIRRILFILTTGLVAAHLLAMLYIARDLALPIEQLGKYALKIHKRNPLEKAPKGFKIRELNYLAQTLDSMVARLEERAKELEAAWQEAEAANQLKSEFLANTSHELRTPLNAIIGCIRLVRDGCCDDREEELDFLQRADEAAIHLLKIINDLLDIAKIEAGTLSLTLEPVNLQQLLKEVVDLQAVQIQQKGLKLTQPTLRTAIVVYADFAKLKQVLLNVIFNAIKFTDHGGITITTRIETQAVTSEVGTKELGAQHSEMTNSNGWEKGASSNDRDHLAPPDSLESWVVIAVRDTGIGIDPTQQHKLFRPFVMIDGTTTRKFEGTGLGLAISRHLIELMGGSITLRSAGVGQGTTVEIALPIFEAAPLLSSESRGLGDDEVGAKSTSPDLATHKLFDDTHRADHSALPRGRQ